jgi:hypothetical protein
VKKIIAMAAEPISADALRSAVRGDVEDAEVLVVAPALNSKLRFWVSDPDPAIHRAEDVAKESVDRLEEEGVAAHGETGESDPLLALQDALTTFEAEDIVLVTHPGGEQNWLEDGVVDQVRETYADRNVTHLEMQRD